jgi:hypothetical protein
MKKCLMLILLTGLIRPLPETVGRTTAGDALAAAALAPADMQADFDLMRQALEEAHTGLYRHSPKAEMDRAFEEQRARLSRPMTKWQYFAVLSESLARVRCGHTRLLPDDEMQAAVRGARKFPLRVLIEGRRLIVLFNDTPDDSTVRPGMEILEINGRTAADILDRLGPTLPADGDIETGKRAILQSIFGDLHWMLVEQADSFTVKARAAAGAAVTATLAGVTDADRATNKNPVNAPARAGVQKVVWTRENLALRFLRDPEVAEIRIRQFGGNDYPRWVEDAFKTLREKGTKSLVIDLRGNGGGNDMYGAMLVSYLTDKPFRYFDHINIKTVAPSFRANSDWRGDRDGRLQEGVTSNPAGGHLVTAKLHPGVAEQPPGKYPFLGNVFVLIDGGTFSTAADFCAVTHHLRRATFVGEETGGGYYGNNSGLQAVVTLPHSKLRVRVPMYEYWNAVPGYDGKRRGTRPDHAVEAKAADLLRGVDEVLDLALRLAATSTVPR